MNVISKIEGTYFQNYCFSFHIDPVHFVDDKMPFRIERFFIKIIS